MPLKKKLRPHLYAHLIPKPAQIRKLRGTRTQEEAAAIVYVSWRTWQAWEAGVASMPPGLWELAQAKVLVLKEKAPD